MNPASPDDCSALRQSLSEPIAQLKDAARYLDTAVSAHLQQKPAIAEELFRLADMPEIRRWTKLIWANSEIHVRARSSEPTLAKELRAKERMPTQAEKSQVHQRDGYHCRFCGMPVVRSKTRKLIHQAYPQAVIWGDKEAQQHAAFQAMWAQYDHVVPHSRGGTNDLENLVLTCAPCNFGRAGYTLQEVAVTDPRSRLPVQSQWDGLERFR
jgi:5-methylcytosine-specific restriction endonuclease McrA